jgi:predicted nucleic acid-binding protein
VKPAVINASPLIILGRAGYVDLLPKVFSSVAIPHAVAAELRAGPAESFGDFPTQAGWLSLVEAGSLSSPLTTARLGPGESEVLEYARIHSGVIAVLDDKAARRMAVILGIPLTGTLGVLAAAVQARHLSDFETAAERVIRAGLFVDANTVARIAEGLRAT